MSGERSEGLESFVAIVEQGSIAAAARHLGAPRETISRRLSRLEDRLAVRLLHRSTRDLRPTAAGKALYVHARRMVDAADEGIRAVRLVDDTPRGVLRVSLPPGGTDGFAQAMFSSFLATWPEVDLEVIATNRYVDLRAEGVDVALRGGTSRDESLIARRLWQSGMLAVASAAYVERNGLPKTRDELGGHECVLVLEDGHPMRRWPTCEGDMIPVRGRFSSNDWALRMAMVRGGVGIGMTLRTYVEDELASGALVSVLPELLGATAGMSVVFAEKEKMQPNVRAFIDHVVRWFAENGVERAVRPPR